ncbi:MAG TPA: hypothetical protein VF731_12350 [Solirubrobacterales bacterium]
MTRKLDFGSVLNEIFAIYTSNAGVLLPIAFWVFLVVAIVNGVTANHLALFPLDIAVSFVAGTIYQGTVVGLVRDVKGGRRDFSSRELVSAAMPVVWPLIGAGVLSGFGIAAGFILFVVPGLYLVTIWAVIAPAIVIERRGAIEAFGRSRELVRGNGWPVFGVLVVAFLITFVGGTILVGIGESVADGVLVRIVFSALASTITAPILALAASVIYYRLLPAQGAPAATPDIPPPAA